MWQTKFTGVLGIWIIALAFLSFSVSLTKVLLVVTGLFIVLVSFLGKKFIRSTKDIACQLDLPQ